MGVYDTFDWYYERRLLKSGKLGKRVYEVMGPYYTPLFHCGLCSCWGSPRKVCYRSDCHSYDLDIDSVGATLCTGCWNTVRSLVRKYQKLQELKTMANTLKKVRAA